MTRTLSGLLLYHLKEIYVFSKLVPNMHLFKTKKNGRLINDQEDFPDHYNII